MSVYEVYSSLYADDSNIVCKDYDSGEVFRCPLELPVDFAQEDEWSAEFFVEDV